MNKIIFFLFTAFLCAVSADVPNPKNFVWKCSDYTALKNGTAVADVPKNKAAGQHFIYAEPDLSGFAGKNLVFKIRVKAENVTKPPQSWNGVKFMLSYKDASGKDFYMHPTNQYGSFEREIYFGANIPQGINNAKMSLGLQDSAGKVTFFMDTFSIHENKAFIKKNSDHIAEYSKSVRMRPRMRGAMLGENMTEADYRDFAAYGANLGRCQLIRLYGRINANQDLAEYDKWMEKRLDRLEQEFEWAHKYGIKMIIDLHTPPGGRDISFNYNMLYEKRYMEYFVELWRKIVMRFKDKPALWGYNLVNEPVQTGLAKYDYWEIQRIAAEEIRKLDSETPIYIESNLWSSPETFSYFSPLKLKNIIYQLHMYQPTAYTHQFVKGIFGSAGRDKLLAYPGIINGKYFDKAALRKILQPVRDFQLKHKAQILCGEFSAITWAPGAELYLKDCIELFEEYGWDWCYHAFREWKGWSLEHVVHDFTKRTFVPSSDNLRKQAVVNGWKRNKK